MLHSFVPFVLFVWLLLFLDAITQKWAHLSTSQAPLPNDPGQCGLGEQHPSQAMPQRGFASLCVFRLYSVYWLLFYWFYWFYCFLLFLVFFLSLLILFLCFFEFFVFYFYFFEFFVIFFTVELVLPLPLLFFPFPLHAHPIYAKAVVRNRKPARSDKDPPKRGVGSDLSPQPTACWQPSSGPRAPRCCSGRTRTPSPPSAPSPGRPGLLVLIMSTVWTGSNSQNILIMINNKKYKWP